MKNKIRLNLLRYSWFLLFPALLPLKLFPQQDSVLIYGRSYDERTGLGLNSEIFFNNNNTGTADSFCTDQNGYFKLKVSKNYDYSILNKMDGYLFISVNVDNLKDSASTFKIDFPLAKYVASGICSVRWPPIFFGKNEYKLDKEDSLELDLMIYLVSKYKDKYQIILTAAYFQGNEKTESALCLRRANEVVKFFTGWGYEERIFKIVVEKSPSYKFQFWLNNYMQDEKKLKPSNVSGWVEIGFGSRD